MPTITVTGSPSYGSINLTRFWFWDEIHGWTVTFAIPADPPDKGSDFGVTLHLSGTLWDTHPLYDDPGHVWIGTEPAITYPFPPPWPGSIAWPPFLYGTHLDSGGMFAWPSEYFGTYDGTPYGTVVSSANSIQAAVNALSAAGGGTLTLYVLEYKWGGIGYGPSDRLTGFETLDAFDLTLEYISTGGGGGGGDDDDVDTDSPGLSNLETTHGSYYRTAVTKSGSVRIWRTSFTVPLPWHMINRVVTQDHADSDPMVIEDWHGSLILVFARKTDGAFTVYETRSYDDGETWSNPAVAIEGGSHPVIAISQGGITPHIVEAASVSGTVQGRSRSLGDTAWSDVFTFKDDLGADFTIDGDSFDIAHAAEGPSRWVMVCIKHTETGISEWWSADECRTWTRVA